MSNEPSPPLPKMTPEENVKPTWKIGCWTYFCVIAFALIVLVWFNIFRSGPPLRMTKETTYITEPLTPDGRYVDYFAALEQRTYPPEMQTDENGFRVVFRAIGPLEYTTPELMPQRYEKLGLDFIRDKPTMTFVEPQGLLDKRLQSNPEDFDLVFADVDGDHEARRTFPLGLSYVLKHTDFHKLPIVQKWREANDDALNLVAEQVKKPVFVTPYLSDADSFVMLSVLLPDAQAMRAFARGFEARVAIRISEGDIDGTMDDILACYRLGRHMEKKSFLVEGLVGIAIEGIADAVPYDLNPEIKANTEQLKRLQEGIAALPPRKGFLHKMECERFMGLDCMTSVMKDPLPFHEIASGSAVGFSGVEYLLLFAGLDWNSIFKNVNKVYDEMNAGTYTYTKPSMNPARLLTLKHRSEAVTDIFIALLVPAVDAANEAYRRIECTMNMKRIVLAMHLYEREHGTLPPAFSVDDEGKPMHSWRTLLLPYLGDDSLAELYAQIKLDEPWDSEHNRQFHTRNLDIYRCPGADKNDGEASYAVIVGDELLFSEDGKGKPLTGFARNMIMLTERKEGVCWMRPDAEIFQNDAETGLVNKGVATIGSNHTGGANIGMRDGSVNFISETTNETVFTEQIRGSEKRMP